MKITKHFVTVGKRRVHYLRAGSGPGLAMLHASPCSAKVMRPLLPVFGEREHVGIGRAGLRDRADETRQNSVRAAASDQAPSTGISR